MISNKISFGARPPPSYEWMEGKTVAEIYAIAKESELTGKTCAEVIAAGDDWKKHLKDKS